MKTEFNGHLAALISADLIALSMERGFSRFVLFTRGALDIKIVSVVIRRDDMPVVLFTFARNGSVVELAGVSYIDKRGEVTRGFVNAFQLLTSL